jgi:hypothetical protein
VEEECKRKRKLKQRLLIVFGELEKKNAIFLRILMGISANLRIEFKRRAGENIVKKKGP